MIQITTSHTTGSYVNSISLNLTLTGDNLNEYGIAYSISPNVQNHIKKQSTTILIHSTCICNYYIFKLEDKYSPLGEIESIPFTITYTNTLTNDFIDTTSGITPDQSDIDEIYIAMSDHTNSSVLFYQSQYFIPWEFFNKAITSTDFNKYDHIDEDDFIRDRYWTNAQAPDGTHDIIVYGGTHESLPRRNVFISRLRNAVLQNPITWMSNVVYDHVDILPQENKVPDILTYYNNKYYSYIFEHPTILFYTDDLHIGHSQDDKDNNIFEITLTDQWGQSDTVHLPSQYSFYCKQQYQFILFGDIKLHIKLNGISSSSREHALMSKSHAYNMLPNAPIIDPIITNGKIKVTVSSLAKKLVYKLHQDTTTFDTVVDYEVIDLNREILDFIKFSNDVDPITTKTVEIDCTSLLCSMEAFVSMGLLEEAESAIIISRRIFPWLTDLHEHNMNHLYNSTEKYSSPLYTILDYSSIENEKRQRRFLLGSSEKSKQILNQTGNLKRNTYNVITDDIEGRIEVNSTDTTTFNVDIIPLLNTQNVIKIIQLITDRFVDYDGSYRFGNELQLDMAFFIDEVGKVKSNEDILNAYNSLDTRIIRDDKMLLMDGIGKSSYHDYYGHMLPLGNGILQVGQSSVGSIQYTKRDSIESSLYKDQFTTLIDSDILISKFDIELTHMWFFDKLGNNYEGAKNDWYYNINNSVDKDLILNAMNISKIVITSGTHVETFNFTNHLANMPIPQLVNSDLGDQGFSSIAIHLTYSTDWEDIPFTDPILQNYEPINMHICVCPTILLSGGNIALNGTDGIDGKLKLAIDTFITDQTCYIDNTSIDTTVITGTNVGLINVNLHTSTTNNYVLHNLMMFGNDDTLEKSVEVIINNEYSKFCNFSSPTPTTNLHVIADPFATSGYDKWDVRLSYSGETGCKLLQDLQGHKRYQHYGERYFRSRFTTDLPPLQLCQQGNYYNPNTNVIEFDVTCVEYPINLNGIAFNKNVIDTDTQYYKTSKFNTEIAEHKRIVTIPYSYELQNEEAPIAPIVVFYRFQNIQYELWEFGAAVRAIGSGRMPLGIFPNNYYHMPEYHKRQQFYAVLYGVTKLRLHSNYNFWSYNNFCGYFMIDRSSSDTIDDSYQGTSFIIRAYDLDNVYPDVSFYPRIYPDDQILL